MNPYRLTIEASNPEQLRVNVLALASAYSAPNGQADRVPATAPVTPHAATRGTKQSVNAATAPLPQTPEPNATPEQDEPAPEISLATVRAHLAKLTKDGRSSEVVAALEALGCTRLTDVKPEHYATLLKSLGVPHE